MKLREKVSTSAFFGLSRLCMEYIFPFSSSLEFLLKLCNDDPITFYVKLCNAILPCKNGSIKNLWMLLKLMACLWSWNCCYAVTNEKCEMQMEHVTPLFDPNAHREFLFQKDGVRVLVIVGEFNITRPGLLKPKWILFICKNYSTIYV